VNYISVLPMALTSLGTLFARLGNIIAARASLHESLQISQTNALLPLLLRGILGVGILLQHEEVFAQALPFALVAVQHPSSNQETVELGEKVATQLRDKLSATEIEAAKAWVAETDFDGVVTAVLTKTHLET
ncbi:MAG: hypothetical protein GY805_29865, partial [Chloroflexi bacterium]|nr:hypothetical protein [Chloroflexota bacterium]